jgi:DNA-binding CsgD family transcriptional regulator
LRQFIDLIRNLSRIEQAKTTFVTCHLHIPKVRRAESLGMTLLDKVPGRHDGTLPGDRRVLGALVSWCEALNGAISLNQALEELAAGLGAEAAMIVRTQMADQRPVAIATCDRVETRKVIRPLNRSFGQSYFGRSLMGAREATIWVATQHAEDAAGNPALGDWQSARHMKEFVVLVLASGPRTMDHVELHFRELMSPGTEATLAGMLPLIARVWGSRQVGLVTRSILNHRAGNGFGPKAVPNVNALGVDNPLHLSRAEFRVCVLLTHGLLVDGVARELGLTGATVRSHLRSIYAKLGCSSLAELVFRLMDGKKAAESTATSRLRIA